MRNYEPLLSRFCGQFGRRELGSLTTDSILSFLKDVTHGTKQSTKKLRYSLLSAFFNFVRDSIDPTFKNPCDSPILKRLFRHAKPNHWKIVEKDVVDESIFRTRHPRNRLILELMARCGMRVGEVLKITPNDVDDRSEIRYHSRNRWSVVGWTIPSRLLPISELCLPVSRTLKTSFRQSCNLPLSSGSRSQGFQT